MNHPVCWNAYSVWANVFSVYVIDIKVMYVYVSEYSVQNLLSSRLI
jgi:hypothetical protein